MRCAVFLDRDGTVNVEVHYLDDPARLCLLPGVAEAILLLNKARIPAILVTNQSAIGRGYISSGCLDEIHQELDRELAVHGAYLDAIYCCPHHPDDRCACRKPNPGLLHQAAEEHGLDLYSCFVVGDKASDLEAGRRCGCRTVLVLTGYGHRERKILEGTPAEPDGIAADLLGAVQWILAQPCWKQRFDVQEVSHKRSESL